MDTRLRRLMRSRVSRRSTQQNGERPLSDAGEGTTMSSDPYYSAIVIGVAIFMVPILTWTILSIIHFITNKEDSQ